MTADPHEPLLSSPAACTRGEQVERRQGATRRAASLSRRLASRKVHFRHPHRLPRPLSMERTAVEEPPKAGSTCRSSGHPPEGPPPFEATRAQFAMVRKNKDACIHWLLQFGRLIEIKWATDTDAARLERLALLRECLDSLRDHAHADCRELAALVPRMLHRLDFDERHFLNLVLPIERKHSRGLAVRAGPLASLPRARLLCSWFLAARARHGAARSATRVVLDRRTMTFLCTPTTVVRAPRLAVRRARQAGRAQLGCLWLWCVAAPPSRSRREARAACTPPAYLAAVAGVRPLALVLQRGGHLPHRRLPRRARACALWVRTAARSARPRSSVAAAEPPEHLARYTATPDDTQVQRTTMGAHAHVPWRRARDAATVIEELAAAGMAIVALETARRGRSQSRPGNAHARASFATPVGTSANDAPLRRCPPASPEHERGATRRAGRRRSAM